MLNITKKLVLFVVALFGAALCYASDGRVEAEREWQRALDAYSKREYGVAVEAFERVAELGFGGSDLYYNLGNAYYKLGQQGEGAPFAQGELGRAILNYRRALKIDSSNDDARYNLDLAVDHTNDTEALPLGVLATMWAALRGVMSSNGWAILSVVLFVAALAIVLVYLLSNRVVIRKISFFVAIALIIVSIFGTLFSLSLRSLNQDSEQAVVMCNSVSSVHASPDNTSKVIRQPSQGVTVKVLREHDQWSEIEFADGEKGWIVTNNIERI
jgi:hypothetical protein